MFSLTKIMGGNPILSIIFIFTMCLNMKVFATEYYIDSEGGSDSNNGTSEESPWQTLTKVSGTTFQPGDNIFFKYGSSYSRNVTINGNGTSSNPITISTYGSGNAPSFTNWDFYDGSYKY